MLPKRKAVLKFFPQESKCDVFFDTFKLVYNILNRKLLLRKFLLLVDVKYLELPRGTRFESLKLTPLNKKVLFLANLRSKTNFLLNFPLLETLPSPFES
jgi:hypothetical protein